MSGLGGSSKPGALLNNLTVLRASLLAAHTRPPPGNCRAPLEPPPPHPAVD